MSDPTPMPTLLGTFRALVAELFMTAAVVILPEPHRTIYAGCVMVYFDATSKPDKGDES
jgi:hypothetical protein